MAAKVKSVWLVGGPLDGFSSMVPIGDTWFDFRAIRPGFGLRYTEDPDDPSRWYFVGWVK